MQTGKRGQDDYDKDTHGKKLDPFFVMTVNLSVFTFVSDMDY